MGKKSEPLVEPLGGWPCENCGHPAIRHLTTGACDYGHLGAPDETLCDCPLLEHPKGN